MRSTPTPRLCLAAALLVLAAGAAGAQTFTATVAAPDGTLLATDVYFPIGAGWGPWPVILQRTPYGKQAYTVQRACQLFNLWGYACVGQDERGCHDSGGVYTGYVNEGGDGRATLDWIAGQPWCDGNIGTFGGSALGMTQYAFSPGANPALKCMVAVVATPDFYHDATYQGGALRYALDYGWLADQNALDAFTSFQHLGGPRALGNQKVIIGPWTHYGTFQQTQGEFTFPTNAIFVDDFIPIARDWFDHWLKGGKAGVASWPAAQVYLMGAVGERGAPGNQWLDLPDWPPLATVVPFFLGGGRSLATLQPPPTEVGMVMDPANPVPTLGGQELSSAAGPYDQRPLEARPDVLSFSTPALVRPVTVVGRVRCRLWIRPDTPDLDLTVRLTDVYPDGRSMLATDGNQRARMRCGDSQECVLTPGVPTEIVVDMWSTAIIFNARHRIRIDVAGSNAPRFEVNPNDGGDLNHPSAGIVARSVLLLGPDTPSRLELPVLRTSAFLRRRLLAGQRGAMRSGGQNP
jgi:predicted acyl esterase